MSFLGPACAYGIVGTFQEEVFDKSGLGIQKTKLLETISTGKQYTYWRIGAKGI